MVAYRRARWKNDALAFVDHQALQVCYKHHLDRIEVNPGEYETFFRYTPHSKTRADAGGAWEWGEVFKQHVIKSGKMIVAEPEWEGGKIVSAESIDYDKSLLIRVDPLEFENIKMYVDPEYRLSGWCPDGYANPDHIWNHPDLRR